MSSRARQHRLELVHNAARLLQNISYSHLNKEIRKECGDAARALYREFGEPPEPVTSTGGNSIEPNIPACTNRIDMDQH